MGEFGLVRFGFVKSYTFWRLERAAISWLGTEEGSVLRPNEDNEDIEAISLYEKNDLRDEVIESNAKFIVSLETSFEVSVDVEGV